MTILSNSRLEALGSGTFQAAVGATRTHSVCQSAFKGTSLENNPPSFFRISFLCDEPNIDSACMHIDGAWSGSASAIAFLFTTHLATYFQNTRTCAISRGTNWDHECES